MIGLEHMTKISQMNGKTKCMSMSMLITAGGGGLRVNKKMIGVTMGDFILFDVYFVSQRLEQRGGGLYNPVESECGAALICRAYIYERR